ncbi:MAG: DUF5050 domain-containing protein, partial [Candidatus Cloacimonetes bacterium]|nr:DUF5050 domain-containing protein [Candidatus Cloacimonadota bacterium]
YYDGIRELSISYDDRYIAFTSNHQIYLFDIDSESHTRISSGCIDEYPEFGIDNRIYFSRYDSENDRYKLMRMEIDGTDKQNLCECSLFISHIFPGQADSNIVYFIGNKKRFCRFCIEESELTVLFTHPVEMKPISKSNNDRYFSFGGDQKSYYLYDTELNSIEAYLTPPEWGKLILRMLPTEKVAVTIPIAGQAILRLLDIENGMQIGDEIIIENTANSAESAFAISPNGEKIAFIHQEK